MFNAAFHAQTPLSVALAAGLAFSSLCGFACGGGPGSGSYETTCQALDERYPLAEEAVTTTFDEEGHPTFTWDGEGAQQLIVWDLDDDAQVWNLRFVALDSALSADLEASNAILPGVRYGAPPPGLPEGEVVERPTAAPLVAGHVYEVSVLMGCRVPLAGEVGASGNNAAGPTGRFVLPE